MAFDEDLLCDAMPWLLALAFADNAFRDYATPAQLWRQQVPPNRKSWRLFWKEDLLDVHVFRSNSSSRQPLLQQRWNSLWYSLLVQAGYPNNITIHRIRQEVVNLVDDSGATEQQHKHVAGQTKSVYESSYMHSISSLDLQSLFTGKPQRRDHIEHLQSVSRDWVGGVPTSLPKRRQELAMRQDQGFQRLVAERRAANMNSADTRGLDSKIQIMRKKILRAALTLYKQEWLDQDYQLSLSTGGDRHIPTDDIAAGRFDRLLDFMPEHGRVVDTLGQGRICSHTSRQALVDDLTVLASQEVPTLYRPGQTPSDGRCTRCREPLQWYA